jgi:serine/threonine protein kinase
VPAAGGARVIAGRYELLSRLGAGGMGEVWRARHLGLGREVAVKLLAASSAPMRERLQREARLLAELRHDAIVQVFDFGQTEAGAPYLVLELLRGDTLASHLRREGRLALDHAIELVCQVLEGLEAAHGAGVVHRDVKPDNVILVAGGGGAPRPKLVDFGIALGLERDERLTMAGSLVGTPEYMAPEQLRGERADARVDLWAVTVMLYELITGRLPFEPGGSRDLYALATRIVSEPVPFPSDVDELEGALWTVLTKGLRKDPAHRFQSARELRLALRAAVPASLRTTVPEATASAPTLAPPSDEASGAPSGPSAPASSPSSSQRAPQGEPSAPRTPRPSLQSDPPPAALDAMIRARLGS